MKKNLLFILFAHITTLGFSQQTYMPDDAFESMVENDQFNNDNYVVLDDDSLNFKSITETAIAYNKTFNLKPGIYSLVFAWNMPYYSQIGLNALSYKNMNFSILTNDVNNVNVTKNTWDIYRLLENDSLNQVEYLRPNTIGSSTVNRIVNNAATTTRFNNVRI